VNFFGLKGRGMGLVDIMIALAVVVIALIPVIMMLQHSTSVMSKTRAYIIGYNLMMEAYEWIMAMPYDEVTEDLNDSLLKLEDYTTDSGYTITYPKSLFRNMGNVKRYIQIDEDTATHCKYIELTVEWKNLTGDRKSKMVYMKFVKPDERVIAGN